MGARRRSGRVEGRWEKLGGPIEIAGCRGSQRTCWTTSVSAWTGIEGGMSGNEFKAMS